MLTECSKHLLPVIVSWSEKFSPIIPSISTKLTPSTHVSYCCHSHFNQTPNLVARIYLFPVNDAFYKASQILVDRQYYIPQ
jgi:hypothetical protein